MDYHEWTTEMDYLNGRLNDYSKLPTLNIDDRLHLCVMSKFLTASTSKLETESFLDTVITIIDRNNQALVIFFFF